MRVEEACRIVKVLIFVSEILYLDSFVTELLSHVLLKFIVDFFSVCDSVSYK
jgi:hypothetical protein